MPNILKTIEPLFLDALKEEFDAAYNSTRKLEALLERIGAVKVFDPACGSGNFLVIAYKELRRLEHAILELLANIARSTRCCSLNRRSISRVSSERQRRVEETG